MKKVILAGLPYTTNLGDVVLFEATKNMIKKSISEKTGLDCEIVPIDLTGFTDKEDTELKRHRLALRDPSYLSHRLILSLKRKVDPRSITCEIIASRVKAICKSYIDEDVIAIIFSGGGIIKYRYEYFPPAIDAITKLAEIHSIPVMFSGVGVEGFDDNDPMCRMLEKAINRSCVKISTTRDDLASLRRYVHRKDQIIDLVADPACSIGQVYPVKFIFNKRKRIGINVVRTGLFADNGIPFNEEEQMRLWSEIFIELTERGYDCRLFCNGLAIDYNAGKRIEERIKKRIRGAGEILLASPTDGKEIIDLISSFDGIVSCRLHSAIISYAYGIPFVGLVWNDKQVFFGKEIGHEERMILKRDFDSKTVADHLEKALEEGYDERHQKEYISTTEKYIKAFIDTLKL